MKKLFATMLIAVLLVLCMAVTAGATDFVYYENDFSDPATISDFEQYRGEWAIEDGALKLKGTGKGIGYEEQVFMLYTADEAIMNLTDYILEVDVTPNAFAGVLTRCDVERAYAESATGYCGYQFAIDYSTNSSNVTKESFSFDRVNTAGGFAGSLGAATFEAKRNYTHHVKMTVHGADITIVVTDESGAELWNYTVNNNEWAMGTFGFTAVPADMSVSMVNVGLLKFDNLKVTAIGDVGTHLANGGKLSEYVPTVASDPIVVEKVSEKDIDFSKNEYVLYENDFSNADSLADFTQVRGEWVIQDEKLYLASTDDGCVFSFLAYTADSTGLVGLASDYTVEVDLYDVMAAAGVLSYVDTSLFSGDSDNTFYGYLSFASNDAKKAAIGASDATATYANIKVSGGVLTPGNDYHIVVRHLDGKVYFSFTDIETGALAFEHETTADKWTTGSFGFRMRAANGDAVNTMTAAFDNLKVTVIGDEAALINSGFSPNAEIVYDKEEVVVTTPVETTAEETEALTTAAATEEPTTNDSFPIVPVVIIVAVVAVLAIVVVIIKGKKK